jgi:hypothetical protein
VSDFAPALDTDFADKDVAETFAESDLSLSHNNTQVTGESVGLSTPPPESLTRPSDGSTKSTDSDHGLVFQPSQDITDLTFYQSSNTVEDDVRLVKMSDGSEIASGTFDGSGEWSPNVQLDSGVKYRVVVDPPDGTAVNVGEKFDVSYPITGSYFDITGGYDEALGESSSYAWAISQIDAAPVGASGSGTVTIDWPDPPDVYRWDAAVFQSTPEAGSVDVYIEEAQGSPGWTTIAGPIQRGQEITADPSNSVRFRVEISSPDSSNYPTLDSIARRWVL